MDFSKGLLSQEIWQIVRDRHVPASAESIELHYSRARSLCQQSGLTVNDIQHLTPKFWDFHFDPTRDATAFTIATIHINLCIGTISRFASSRPDLLPLLDSLVKFDVCGSFMLTEVGHGLDARNIETTATLRADGSFELNSPNGASWKAMPPTTPLCGLPRVAVVFARLIVGSEDRGIKPFIVHLSDPKTMRPGITSTLLPMRPGTKPLDHALTHFDHVSLPPSALLGSMSKPDDPRKDFLQQIWRVSVGTLSLSIASISSIKVASSIVAAYSRRRLVTAPDMTKVPIFQFSTQHRPILRAVASGAILETFARWTIEEYTNKRQTQSIRHALATIFKATATRESQVLVEMLERCGWQGLFSYNQISELALALQGNSIAEGDALVLCIRLASEVLGGKYSLPKAKDPTSAMARHEYGLFREAGNAISGLGGYDAHRSQAFDNHILPRCRLMIEAVGHRMAYEAAQAAGIDEAVLLLYERLCMSADLSWYTENGITTRSSFFASVDEAYEAALPVLLRMLDEQEPRLRGYISAPIASAESWDSFLPGLQTFGSKADGSLKL
ncbi:Acyl-CoA dehydrogenase/oxidase [Trichoderma cornu-damae]|uniref:Acyl-CoA dehydrogenase/oxidase n=1 Tax=Trichoderma cornu-damae TaxID=654480 RepID=A0A9P8QG19_9HYPO|nr:Acyl-CoA dehydrogenase/oxidase [Trichoderma cornu-damae]